ncbi:FAD-linked oxidase [Arsenicicoccus sp. oral taxon 190]|nr:FAD-linked oxidase [Arsenicicoccus sp. oral taxon 190]
MAAHALDAALGIDAPADFTLVRARDVDDVVETLRWAAAERIPVVPQGARTGLAGGAVPLEGGVALNLEAMRDIEDVDEVEGLACVQAGVITADLKEAAAAVGLHYGPDPASVAISTVGGNVATNAGGLCCLKYGATSDAIRALEVVLPGGEVIRTGHRTAKGVAGFDLTGLFVGSEGCLGVVTRAWARLGPRPDEPATVLATFPTLRSGCDAIVALRRERHRPNLVEIMDGPTVEAIRAYGDYGFPAGVEAALLVQSDRPEHAAQDATRYAEVCASAGATSVTVSGSREESTALMAGRRVISPALDRLGHNLTEDMCVPVRHLAEFIERGYAIGERHGTRIITAGHGGDGNLHPTVYFDPEDPEQVRRAHEAITDLVDAALRLGGTITGEHGVGILKSEWLPRELGAAEIERQRGLKAFFDPLGIMNPGRVLWPPTRP